MSSFYAKNEDAASALELKKTLIAYDRSLLVADPRRMEPKKFGGRGARARRQKVSFIRQIWYFLEKGHFADLLSLTDKRLLGSLALPSYGILKVLGQVNIVCVMYTMTQSSLSRRSDVRCLTAFMCYLLLGGEILAGVATFRDALTRFVVVCPSPRNASFTHQGVDLKLKFDSTVTCRITLQSDRR
jgi:hypothetical protein